MRQIPFIRLLLPAMFLMTAPAAFVSPATAAQPASPKIQTIKPNAPGLNIMELANAQMYRYGREMFHRGNYAEAVRIFARILSIDCRNKVAQYHLQKIADMVPDYAYLKQALKDLPCEAYDFTKEDFLPASVYYQKDPDLILEQLASYHKRQRLNEQTMNETIEQYNTMVRELELTITTLMKNGSAAADDTQDTAGRLEAGRKIAFKIEKEIDLLKNQLAAERLDRQKEVQDLRTRLAAAESRLAGSNAIMPERPKTPERPSPGPAAGNALATAVDSAKAELKSKEAAMADNEQALATLQARFDEIQRKLRLIQDEVAGKNAQVQAIQTNLQDIQKP